MHSIIVTRGTLEVLGNLYVRFIWRMVKASSIKFWEDEWKEIQPFSLRFSPRYRLSLKKNKK